MFSHSNIQRYLASEHASTVSLLLTGPHLRAGVGVGPHYQGLEVALTIRNYYNSYKLEAVDEWKPRLLLNNGEMQIYIYTVTDTFISVGLYFGITQ